MEKRFLYQLIIIIFIFLGHINATASDECLSLEEYIRIALRNRGEMQASIQTLESARLNLIAKKRGSGYRTDLSVSYEYKNQDLELETTTEEQLNETLKLQQSFPWGTSFNLFINNNYLDDESIDNNVLTMGVALQQELLIPIELKLDIDEATILFKSAQENVELKKRKIILEVIEAYYNYVRAYQVLEVRRDAYRIAKALSRLATKQFEHGIAIDIDLIEAQISESFTFANMQSGFLDIKKARNNLKRAIGVFNNNTIPCIAIHRLQLILPHKDELKNLVEKHPILKILDLQVRKLNIDKIREKKKYQSSLILKTSYQRSYKDVSISGYRQIHDEQWFLGFFFNIPLWDNGINQNNVESIEYKIKSKISTINDTRISLERDLINDIQILQELSNILTSLEKANKYAEKNLQLMNEKFIRGLNKVNDVIRAEQNLTDIRLSILNKTVEYNLTIANLYFLTGDANLLHELLGSAELIRVK